ncbi:MAG: hypothetical protein AB7I38_18155 [Dehalococcoidia bacterium]|uniref:hypothetical protein n=1 Tax=Paenarthrobacter ureafaciens TaxID=37931 RepID=UPI000FA855E3|nr:hypothetical protein [Paenarthrobacter ureafaciens]MBN9128265.1 hypothetical protein [Paenarthrobacter ureafaciens]RTL61273.1 MAG: hypothetical protein EKK42_35640 [Pseudonocardiaceae bacterium]
MNLRPVIDAGPALNFFSTNQERLLLATLGPISTPETVRDEVLRKARADARFEPAERVWNRLPARLLEILSDAENPELNAAVTRISQLPMAERSLRQKDYGEIMVIAHAVVAAEAGHTVTVLIDDGEGTRLATTEIERLDRLRTSGSSVGAIRLVGTPTVLERAAGSEHLPDKAAMRKIYEKLRLCDDGLMPIERTRLLASEVWRPSP